MVAIPCRDQNFKMTSPPMVTMSLFVPMVELFGTLKGVVPLSDVS